MNNELERIWKEAVVDCFKELFGFCLEGLREITKYLSQDSRFSGQDLNTRPPAYDIYDMKYLI
jgi:hypothetical protein